MGITTQACPELVSSEATESEEGDDDEEEDDEDDRDYEQEGGDHEYDGSGSGSGGSGNGYPGGSGAGASGQGDPGASGSGAAGNNPPVGSLKPWAFNAWVARAQWPLSCIVDEQPNFCAEGFQCVSKHFQSPNLRLLFGLLESTATNLLDKLGTCWVLGPSSSVVSP